MSVSEDTKTHGFHHFCNCVYDPKKTLIVHILKRLIPKYSQGFTLILSIA